MRVWKIRHKERNYLLPLILAVVVFFIAHGICVPQLFAPQEAQFSKPREAKRQAVVNGQAKSPQSRILKSSQTFTLCTGVSVSDVPVYRLLTFSCPPYSSIAVFDSASPSRAPPA
ncbi:hypothetical protein [Geobacter sp. SVR]|uniref:hypothetical protein n=1 Tax=Geobacter sp. SVR TaxID=2495594 RepID=UPI00143EF7EE|nr:hypothetical protein [Geobacter sp. SVR]BCS52488.1 hypothetical protein GSVR_07960 [Geobacter sp. SVR]GCF84075.1 hypothetical protein GSbR_06750 [Geobacter sp. SVR]